MVSRTPIDVAAIRGRHPQHFGPPGRERWLMRALGAAAAVLLLGGMAQLGFFSGAFLEGAAAQEAYAKARAAGDRALTLAPDLAAAHNARGDLLQSADFDWHGAEAEYRRALELAPKDVLAKLNLASQLAAYGELDQAIELTRQALVTEPLRAGGYRDLATYFLGLHRLDEAERAIDKAIEQQAHCHLYAPDLCTAAGLAARERIERRRFDLLDNN